MASDPETSSLIDRFTHFAMHQVSRRGFLKGTGATGLALAGPLAGISRLLQRTPTTLCNNDNCPGSCTGICNCQSSSCIVGGKQRNCFCPSICGNCTPFDVEAQGDWFWFNPSNSCVFTCNCVAC